MSDQYVGEIRLFPFNFAPQGWALCQGQTLAVSSNTALFSLLGTNYGGNGASNFQLPNLQGQVAVNSGQARGLSPYVVGETAGQSTVTLIQSTMAAHNHAFNVDSADGTATASAGNQLAKAAVGGKGEQVTANLYNATTPNTTLSPTTLGFAGGSQAHNDVQPYLAMTYCIALQGVFPQRS